MTNKYLEEYNRQNLRACQLKQLEILGVIDSLCRRHSIGYWLDGGTLLGAVRHGAAAYLCEDDERAEAWYTYAKAALRLGDLEEAIRGYTQSAIFAEKALDRESRGDDGQRFAFRKCYRHLRVRRNRLPSVR